MASQKRARASTSQATTLAEALAAAERPVGKRPRTGKSRAVVIMNGEGEDQVEAGDDGDVYGEEDDGEDGGWDEDEEEDEDGDEPEFEEEEEEEGEDGDESDRGEGAEWIEFDLENVDCMRNGRIGTQDTDSAGAEPSIVSLSRPAGFTYTCRWTMHIADVANATETEVGQKSSVFHSEDKFFNDLCKWAKSKSHAYAAGDYSLRVECEAHYIDKEAGDTRGETALSNQSDLDDVVLDVLYRWHNEGRSDIGLEIKAIARLDYPNGVSRKESYLPPHLAHRLATLTERRRALLNVEMDTMAWRLKKAWACKQELCRNYRDVCWYPQGDDRVNQHHPVEHSTLAAWALDMLRGKANLDTTSTSVLSTLVSARLNHNEKERVRDMHEAELRDARQSRSTVTPSRSPPASPPAPAPPTTVIYNFYHGPHHPAAPGTPASGFPASPFPAPSYPAPAYPGFYPPPNQAAHGFPVPLHVAPGFPQPGHPNLNYATSSHAAPTNAAPH